MPASATGPHTRPGESREESGGLLTPMACSTVEAKAAGTGGLQLSDSPPGYRHLQGAGHSRGKSETSYYTLLRRAHGHGARRAG